MGIGKLLVLILFNIKMSYLVTLLELIHIRPSQRF